MPGFRYQAINAEGRTIQGQRNAASVDELANQLQQEELIPLEIQLLKKEKSKEAWQIPFLKEKVPVSQLQMFCRQMYTVLKAGVPIGTAVAKLSETTRNKRLAAVLQGILVEINKGQSLHVALSQYKDVFSDFFIQLVRTGEATGQLDIIFLRLSEYISLEVDTKKRIKAAVRYPLTVLGATVIALLIINVFVVPAFSALFKSFKAELPLMTRILITTSDFLINDWYVIIGVMVLLFFAVRYYLNTPDGALKFAKWQLSVPIVGGLIHRIILARFASLYALALRAGLPALDAIELVGVSTGNLYMSQKIKQVTSLIARGKSIASAITQTELFSPLVIQMITLGEETGSIDTLLEDVADFYQREINYDLVRLSDAIEPIMLVIMGVIVLMLALGVFLPLWELAGNVAR